MTRSLSACFQGPTAAWGQRRYEPKTYSVSSSCCCVEGPLFCRPTSPFAKWRNLTFHSQKSSAWCQQVL